VFNVTYVRQGKTNNWAVSTPVPAGLALEGVGTTGAFFSTGIWESEFPGDEDLVVVTVLIECDPRLRGPSQAPDIWRVMIEEARSLADKAFKANRPKAVIKRD
jgi:hypothetical protein